MRTRLTSVGDEFGLVLDQETLDAVGYTVETEVELRVEEDRLIIEPVRVTDSCANGVLPAGGPKP